MNWALPVTRVAIVVCSMTVFFGNLRFGGNVLAVGFEDDFFYYAQVARNLAFHGISSFDGVHLTNGYHPLWLLVITAVMKVFGRGPNVLPFAVALETLQLGLVLAISYFALRICRQFCSDTVCACILLLQASFAIVLMRSGMEVGLAIASGLVVLWFRLRPGFALTPGSALSLGLLASAFVLSRIDAILLVGLLMLFDLLPNLLRRRAGLSSGFAFLLGLAPVGVYLAINRAVFGTLTPVSGMAKQMRFHHVPSLIALQSFAGFFTAPGSPLLGPCLLVVLVALVLLATGQRKPALGATGVAWAVLLFPFLHLLTIVTLSDWRLWPWYIYPWLLSGIVAAALVFSGSTRAQPTAGSTQRLCFAGCLIFLLGYSAMVAGRSRPGNNLPYAAALELQAFAAGHPGTYAMGDRSGTVGYLLGQPLVQLEGLTMDKAYLENIRAQRDLEPVLRAYGVRYYISTRSQPDQAGCYPVKEPWQAGPDAPAMHGRICREPVAVFQHGLFVNHVFDLEGPVLSSTLARP